MSSAGLGLRKSLYDHELSVQDDAAPTLHPVDRGYRPRRAAPYVSERTHMDPQGVRTVRIRGQVTPPRRRPPVSVVRYVDSPERAALWALLLGIFLVVVAILTGS